MLTCYRKLAAEKVNIPWPITTAQKTSSEVQALIQEELPEDSSDEEYNPEHDDKQSDDDREEYVEYIENTLSSDVESQPSISKSRDTTPKLQTLPHIQYDPEGIFKIPAYVRQIYSRLSRYFMLILYNATVSYYN